MEEKLWPWPIGKPEAEWTEFDRDYINFMRAAYAEGYQPRVGPCSSVELGRSPVGRTVCLVLRGVRNGWESYPGDSGGPVRLGPTYSLPLGEDACVCVRPPFRNAAHLALAWMRGRPLESLLEDFEFVGGHPAGIVLRPEVVPADAPQP
jgi:hypothetical protein